MSRVRRNVINPETGFPILVGSAAFRALVDEGGDFEYDPEVNQIFFRITNTFLIVNMIRDPSPMVDEFLPRSSPIMLTGDTMRIVRRIMHGTAGIDELRNSPELGLQPFLAQYMAQFTWGTYVWTDPSLRRSLGPRNLGSHVIANTELAPHNVLVDFLTDRISADDPIDLPYSNVATNAGRDDACVTRFLDDVLDTSSIVDPTINGVVKACQQHDVECVLFDVLGGVIEKTHPITFPRGVKRAIIYQGHVYPVHGKVPARIHEPRRVYQFPSDVTEVLRRDHLAYFKVNSQFVVGGTDETTGVYGSKEGIYEEWMTEFFNVAPVCNGMDPFVEETLKRSARSLYFADARLPSLIEDVSTTYMTIDMCKCYYETAVHCMRVGRFPYPSMFNQWEETSDPGNFHQNSVIDTSYYRVDESCGPVLSAWGIPTNVLCGATLRLLLSIQTTLFVTHVVHFDHPNAKTMEDTRAVLQSWVADADKKKKYALINGMCAKNENVCITEFELNRQFQNEHAYYAKAHGVSSVTPDLLRRISTKRRGIHMLMLHVHVVQMATYHVLRKALLIRTMTAALPCRIKVDSLMYRLDDLRNPWDPSGRRVLTAETQDGWRIEEPAVVGTPVYVSAQPMFTIIDIPTRPPDTFENITYVGPPGVGKTYAAMNDNWYDIAVCFSNKGARRVGGRTICSAFRLWSSDGFPADLSHLKDKRVFVDEAQSAGRRYWALFLEAYHSVGTRFIFSMDTNQLLPVGEPELKLIPFHGRIINMTKDYRNDEALINAREDILAGAFTPNITETFVQAELTTTNIAFTNRTCALVNRLVCEKLGVGFFDAGVVLIVLLTNRDLRIMKSETAVRVNALEFQIQTGGEFPTTVSVPIGMQRKHFGLGYCTTIHKQIGETIEENFTIWDVDHPRFDRRLLYTSITRARRLGQITFRRQIFARDPHNLNPHVRRANRIEVA